MIAEAHAADAADLRRCRRSIRSPRRCAALRGCAPASASSSSDSTSFGPSDRLAFEHLDLAVDADRRARAGRRDTASTRRAPPQGAAADRAPSRAGAGRAAAAVPARIGLRAIGSTTAGCGGAHGAVTSATARAPRNRRRRRRAAQRRPQRPLRRWFADRRGRRGPAANRGAGARGSGAAIDGGGGTSRRPQARRGRRAAPAAPAIGARPGSVGGTPVATSAAAARRPAAAPPRAHVELARPGRPPGCAEREDRTVSAGAAISATWPIISLRLGQIAHRPAAHTEAPRRTAGEAGHRSSEPGSIRSASPPSIGSGNAGANAGWAAQHPRRHAILVRHPPAPDLDPHIVAAARRDDGEVLCGNSGVGGSSYCTAPNSSSACCASSGSSWLTMPLTASSVRPRVARSTWPVGATRRTACRRRA